MSGRLHAVSAWILSIALLFAGNAIASAGLDVDMDKGDAVESSEDVDALMRKEVARFFELTQAIDVNPVKKRLNVLIHRQMKNNNSGIRQVHMNMAENVVNQQVDLLAQNNYFFEQYYPVYKKFYTVEELRAINDFFASSAGRKFVGARDSLHREVSMASVKMIHRLVDQISPKVEDTLANSGYDVNF